MKINRSFIILLVLAGGSVFAARYADYQSEACSDCEYYSNRASTSNVYRPAGYEQVYEQRRVPLDYHNNEYNKRLPTEHFTYDPEEAGLTER